MDLTLGGVPWEEGKKIEKVLCDWGLVDEGSDGSWLVDSPGLLVLNCLPVPQQPIAEGFAPAVLHHKWGIFWLAATAAFLSTGILVIYLLFPPGFSC